MPQVAREVAQRVRKLVEEHGFRQLMLALNLNAMGDPESLRRAAILLAMVRAPEMSSYAQTWPTPRCESGESPPDPRTDWIQTGNRPDSRRETDWRVNLAADDLGGILDLHRGNLDEVVLDAVKRNERELALVGSGDPLATDRRYQSSAWRLASELRGHPLFADHESYEAVAKVDAVLAGHGGWDAVSQHDVMV